MPPRHLEGLMRFMQKNTPLTRAESACLMARFKPLRLKRNDYFLKVGMPVHKVGYVGAGILRRFIVDEKGNEVILQFIGEEHFFTDLDGFYYQKPSGAYIQAVTPCKLFILSISELDCIREEFPQLKPVIDQISQQNLLERIKMEDFLRTGTAAEQYQCFIARYPHVAQQVPLKYVASYLRITRQSLSRIRRRKM